MIRLQRHFDIADGRRGYWVDQHKQHLRQREDADKRERLAEEAEADFASLATGAIAATKIQLKEIRQSLETYETVTVEALLSNEEALDLVQDQIDRYLAQAHVLDDGRRVFKTRDGTQVFDEFGEEVDLEVISPNEIDDARPVWEDVQAAFDEQTRLLTERQDLLEFQEKLDDARDEADADDVSSDRLDELTVELESVMPPGVQSRIPGGEIDEPSANVASNGITLAGMDAAAKLSL